MVVTEPRALSRQRRFGTREQRGSRRSYDWTEATAPGQRSAVEQPPARPARSWYIDLLSPLLPDSHTFGRLTFILCLHDFSCTYKSGTDPPIFMVHFRHNFLLHIFRTTVAHKQVYYQLSVTIFDITVFLQVSATTCSHIQEVTRHIQHCCATCRRKSQNKAGYVSE